MQTYCQTTPPRPANSREQQRAHSRELILNAAVICFARLGFEAVSIANIGNRSHPEWIALMFRKSASPGPRLTWLIDNYLRPAPR